jgi:hypothetical protein
MINRKELHKALLTLREHVQDATVPCHYFGICGNVVEILDQDRGVVNRGEVYLLLEKYFKGWKHHTGCGSYPVPGDGSPWQDKQLEYRISLLNYTIRNTR